MSGVAEFVRAWHTSKFGSSEITTPGGLERLLRPATLDNLTALRRPKYRQNGKRLPGTEMRAMEKCLRRGTVWWNAGKSAGTLKDWPCGLGRKRETCLRTAEEERCQTMRLSATDTARLEGMS